MSEVNYIQKGNKKVAGQYSYVSHDKVSSTLQPQFVKHGIVVLPSLKEITQDGNRTQVVVEVKFVNVDSPEDQFSVTCAGYGIDKGDKGPGIAFSYACKYALLKTFCLETGDDPEQNQKSEHEPSRDSENSKPKWLPISLTDAQKSWANVRAIDAGFTEADFSNNFGVPGIEELLQTQLERFTALTSKGKS